MASSPDLSHAAGLVREFDRERFVTALFAPAARREELMTLYAFNVEVARVRESVREPMAGLIRLQWWRDTLAGIADGKAGEGGHPLVGGLAGLIRDRGLPLPEFERLLRAREGDLAAAGPADLAAAESYADDSSAALTTLALAVLGADAAGDRAAGRHVGIAWALVGQVRALAFHLSIGRLTLPDSLLRQGGTDGQAVLEGRAPPNSLIPAVREMCGLARSHLDRARAIGVSRTAVPAVLPAVLADGHLRRLERGGWNPFLPALARAEPRPLRLAWASLRGRI